MLLIAVKMNGKWYGRCDGNPDVADMADDIEHLINDECSVLLRRDEDSETEEEAWAALAAEHDIEIDFSRS